MTPGGFTIDGFHSYDDLGMIPKSMIAIAPPIPKLVTFDVPGSDGEIDLTDALTGRVMYNTRQGEIELLVLSGTEYAQAYTNCLSIFNGQKKSIVLDDEPGTTYTGRFWVDKWKSFEQFSNIVIKYEIDP